MVKGIKKRWVILMALIVCTALQTPGMSDQSDQAYLSTWKLLQDKGVPTQGHVTIKDSRSFKTNNWNIGYKYSVGTQIYQGTGQVNGPEFVNMQIGDKVTIFYLPEQPAVSCLGKPNELLEHENIMFGYGLALIIIFLIIMFWWMNEQKKKS